MKKIILVILLMNIFSIVSAEDWSAIYGVFINDGVEMNVGIQNKASITFFFTILNGSLEVKNTMTSFQEINGALGVGFFNFLQIQGGYGTEGFLLKLNSDIPIGKKVYKLITNHNFDILDMDYQYCRDKWYTRINLNSTFEYYFRSKIFSYSIGLGYLLL